MISNVLICDDHAICRIGVEDILSKSPITKLSHIHTAATGAEALKCLDQNKIDLIVVDLGLPDMSGLDVIKHIQSSNLETKILVLTASENPALLNQVIKHKPNALMLKSNSAEKIHEALESITQKQQTYIDPALNLSLSEDPTSILTKREYEVLNLIVNGNTTKEVAAILNCSYETIKTHRTNIMDKIEVNNSAEMTAWFLDKQRNFEPHS